MFQQSIERPFLGGFRLVDDRERLRATFRRDGAGIQVLRMNYAIEDPDRRTIYLIRSPRPRPGIHLGGAFSLLRPDGSLEGQLRLVPRFATSNCTLERAGGETLVATKSNFGRKFEMRAGARIVATGRLEWFAAPAEIHLVFPPPPAPELPRGPLVGLMAFAALHWRTSG